MTTTNHKDTKQEEPFAIVLQSLTASPHFNPSEYRILVACIGVDHITLADGQPFTHSSMGLEKMTNVERRTVQRAIRRFCDLRIFRKHGYRFNKKKKYAVYRFHYDTLKALILTDDKLSFVGTNENTAEMNNDGQLATQQTTKCDTRSNIVEISSNSPVQAGNGTETTEMSERVSGSINTPAITGHSVSAALNETKTITGDLGNLAKATGLVDYKADTTRYSVNVPEPLTISDHLAFEPICDDKGNMKTLKLNVPDYIGVGTTNLAKRQDFIVAEMNRKYNSHFRKDNPTYSEMEGYKVCGYDPKKYWVLVTCDSYDYFLTPYFQKLCNHFYSKDPQWNVWAWVGESQSIVPLAVTKEGV